MLSRYQGMGNLDPSKLDFKHPSFSFRKLREAAYRYSEIREANAESTFGFLLKSAVQEFANDAYKDHPVIYPQLVRTVTSKRRSEVYGGLFRMALPKQVDAGEKFQDTTFKGFERELKNYKYGMLETFERELFDDDQTGQIKTRSAALGEGFKTFEEIYVLARIIGAAQTQETVQVPASTYPGGPFTTLIGNVASPYVRLSAASLEAGHVALRTIVDPTGRKFVVVPNILLVSPIDEFLAWKLINSPTTAISTSNSGSDAQLANPLQNRYKVLASPFFPSKAWSIGDYQRGFIFQSRDSLEIMQENVQSGQSFIQEVYAFRARERFEADWIEPRYAYLGDDGSV